MKTERAAGLMPAARYGCTLLGWAKLHPAGRRDYLGRPYFFLAVFFLAAFFLAGFFAAFFAAFAMINSSLKRCGTKPLPGDATHRTHQAWARLNACRFPHIYPT